MAVVREPTLNPVNKGRHYIIDHHHLARALHEEGRKDVLVTVVANLSAAGCIPSTSMVGDASTATSQTLSASWSTIPTEVSPASCAGSAGLPRTRPHSASFYGPIFCAGGSSGSWSTRTLGTLSKSRWNSQKAPMRITYLGGAGLSAKIDCA